MRAILREITVIYGIVASAYGIVASERQISKPLN